MAVNQYQKLPVPGFENPTGNFIDPEILYSTAGFTQKGVTIGSGQGVLAAGTVLGMRTTDRKYYAYRDTNADGTQTARGILRRPVDTGTTVSPANDQVSNIVIQGIVKYKQVVGLDQGALDDLGATVDVDRNTVKF